MAEWAYEFSAVKTPRGLIFASREGFDRTIDTLEDGDHVVVTVAKRQDKRSLAANRALWGPVYDQVIDGVCRQEGIALGDRHAKELMHEGLLQAFGGTVIDPVTGREVAKERSSSMTVARFREFMDFVAVFAAERGIVVTMPGEI